MGSIQPEGEYDVVVVGAGFSGVWLLYNLRKQGLSVKLLEAGPKAGGVWYWNCYPGARVDTEVPEYQYRSTETWDGWDWKERFPGRDELVDYFQHIIKVWGVESDIEFNTRVDGAHWDDDAARWHVSVAGEDRPRYHSKFLCLCTGFAAKPYTPPFPGLASFRGTVIHTSHWPQEGVDLKGKRVGVIGTGASGIQAIQEIHDDASHLTVFQRTPNTAIPMTNPAMSKDRNEYIRSQIPEWRKIQETTFAGFVYNWRADKASEVSAEKRDAVFEELWNTGGLHFWLGNFADMLTDRTVNDAAYQFWRSKVIARVNDSVVANILAPEVPLHPFGTKRISLEQSFYEAFNKPNVSLVDVRANPIDRLTETGVVTADGETHDLDVLIMATGFDSITGGMTQMDLRGISGKTIAKRWENGVDTYLGMTVADFPNMFYVYGPQAPTAFATGPISAETQGAWILECIRHLNSRGLRKIVATDAAAAEWTAHVDEVGGRGLFSEARSWYFGANIPGKHRQALNYMAGMPAYKARVWDAANDNYRGFELS